ncbi:MAG: type I-B CRISPR-associated protein Cas8b1/Cst1, partial [Candidatus Zipacnadales bacterium]
YRDAWNALCVRGWELSSPKRGAAEGLFTPRYNVLYEDLFRLPEQAASFIRRYFLRVPVRRSAPGDPRAAYSVRGEAGLVSWDLTTLFLRKVVNMNKSRIESIRQLGDALAAHVNEENDRRFFQTLLNAGRYDALRAALIRVSVARVRRGKPPLVQFDPYIQVFEEGEDLPYADWRLARDLVLIRVIEQLHQLGWLTKHAEELPEPVADESETT